MAGHRPAALLAQAGPSPSPPGNECGDNCSGSPAAFSRRLTSSQISLPGHRDSLVSVFAVPIRAAGTAAYPCPHPRCPPPRYRPEICLPDRAAPGFPGSCRPSPRIGTAAYWMPVALEIP